jgi:hypothetical protein
MNKILVPHFMDAAEIINGDDNADAKKPITTTKKELKEEGAGWGMTAPAGANATGSAVLGLDATDDESESGYESSDYCGKSSGLL